MSNNSQNDMHNLSELPLKFLVLGDFSNSPEEASIAEPSKINVTKENINHALSALSPSVCFSIPGHLQSNKKLTIKLSFKHIRDFRPENIVKQVPALKRLIAIRKQINNLKQEIKTKAQLIKLKEHD